MALKNQNIITYSNLMGGECLVGTPDTIPENCLQLAYNWEYGGEIIQPQVVPGVTEKLDLEASADGGFYDSINDIFLVASEGTLNTVSTDFQTTTALDTLTGANETPVFALYDTVALIASGGALQEFNGTTLSATSGAPAACDHVSTVAGRVRVVDVSTSRVTYSAIGDRTGWTNDPADPSSSQYLDIGYKDPTEIACIMQLSQDTIVIKKSGIAYRIINENDFANISVIPASAKTPAYNYYCGLSVGNNAYFLGEDGFQSFSTTDRYGAVVANDPAPGYFVNPWLVQNSDSGAKMWHVPSRRQIWVKGQNDKLIYLYHYNVKANGVAGSWTRRTFYWQINDVMIKGKDVYVLYGNKIGLIDDTTDQDDGNNFDYTLITKEHSPNLHKYVLNHFNYKSQNMVPGAALLEVGSKTYPYSFASTDSDIYGDESDIYGDDSDIYTNKTTTICKDLQKGVNSLVVKVKGSSGRIAVSNLMVNVSEVNF